MLTPLLLLAVAGACAGVGPLDVCPPGTFRCNQRCLQPQYVCDGKVDCPLAQDEVEASCPDGCRPGAFFCIEKLASINDGDRQAKPRGRCFADYRRCDGNEDCEDGSDERHNCSAPAQELIVCLGETRGWRVRGKLQSSRVVCDGRRDCAKFEDEKRCTKPADCPAGEAFWCNRHCRPIAWRCDTFKDCDDGSDEINCVFTTSTETPTTTTTATTTTTTAATTTTTTTATSTTPSSYTTITEELIREGLANAPAGSNGSANHVSSSISIIGIVLVVALLAMASAVCIVYRSRRRQRQTAVLADTEARFSIVYDDTELTDRSTETLPDKKRSSMYLNLQVGRGDGDGDGDGQPPRLVDDD